MEEIKKYSKKIKVQADLLLSQTEIIKTLSEFGKPEVIGSYKLDLMYDPDLDIIVKTQTPRESSLKAIKELLEKRDFQKYEYGDFVKFKREKRPEGFIICLRKEIDGVKWEIETWFLDSIEKESKIMSFLDLNIQEHHRDKILKMKHDRAENGLSKHNLNSVEIYEKVIGKKFSD